MPVTDLASITLRVLPPSLLEKPLDYLIADHDRQRAVCTYLKRAVEIGRMDPGSAQAIARFLAGDLKQHFEDERLSLYPALIHRSVDDLEFTGSLHQIEQLHAGSEVLVDCLITRLRRLVGSNQDRLSLETRELLLEFAQREQNSLAFENSVILTIAGVRLKRSDLGRISDEMKSRRGIAMP